MGSFVPSNVSICGILNFARKGKYCNTPKYTLVVFNMFKVFCRHKLNFS